jgi:hypothetical protein
MLNDVTKLWWGPDGYEHQLTGFNDHFNEPPEALKDIVKTAENPFQASYDRGFTRVTYESDFDGRPELYIAGPIDHNRIEKFLSEYEIPIETVMTLNSDDYGDPLFSGTISDYLLYLDNQKKQSAMAQLLRKLGQYD